MKTANAQHDDALTTAAAAFSPKSGYADWITVVTNATGTFTGEITLPDGNVIPPTGKTFDLEFAQTSKLGTREPAAN